MKRAAKVCYLFILKNFKTKKILEQNFYWEKRGVADEKAKIEWVDHVTRLFGELGDLGIPRVVLHALAAPRPAQGWRRTDRSPQTSVAPYVGARRLFWQMAEMRSNRVYFVSTAVGLLSARLFGP